LPRALPRPLRPRSAPACSPAPAGSRPTRARPCARRRLALLAGPLCGQEILTFTKELIITSYVGHLGRLELSALVLAQSLYNVTGQAPMMGVVAAMETFCGWRAGGGAGAGAGAGLGWRQAGGAPGGGQQPAAGGARLCSAPARRHGPLPLRRAPPCC
jgi:hypothetical protein